METKFMFACIGIALAYCLALSGCAKPHTYYIDGDCSPITETPSALITESTHALVFNTGSPSELSRCLASPHHLEDAVTVRLYAIKLSALKPGDVLSAGFTAEFTSELPVEAFLAHYMEVKNLKTGAIAHATARHGTNLLPLVHHLTINDGLFMQIDDDADYEISVYAYSATGNDEIDLQNSHLTIESGYGSLSGMVVH